MTIGCNRFCRPRRWRSSGSLAWWAKAGSPKSSPTTTSHYSDTFTSATLMLLHQTIACLVCFPWQLVFIESIGWRFVIVGGKCSDQKTNPLWWHSKVIGSCVRSASAVVTVAATVNYCFDSISRQCRPSFFRKAVSGSGTLTSPHQPALSARQCLLSSPYISHRYTRTIPGAHLAPLCARCEAFGALCASLRVRYLTSFSRLLVITLDPIAVFRISR